MTDSCLYEEMPEERRKSWFESRDEFLTSPPESGELSVLYS